MFNNLFGYTSSSYSASHDYNFESAIGAIVIFFLILLILLIALYIINSIFLSKIFKKAGVPGYIAWIPFWNNWQLFEIGGQQGYLSLLSLAGGLITSVGTPIGYNSQAISGIFALASGCCSIAYIVFFVIAIKNIGNNLGKGNGFAVLGFFLYTIWLGILAFDKSTWQGATNGPIQSANNGQSQNFQQPHNNTPTSPQAPTYMPPNSGHQAPDQQKPQNNVNQNSNQPPTIN